MRTRCTWLVAILLSAPSILSATDLNPQTISAWDAYIQVTNSRMEQRLSGNSSFLWIDEAPGRRERVRQGEILVEPANVDSPEKVPQGLIHDWLGAAFIPNATINSLFAILDDYSDYNRFYDPAVISAKLRDNAGTTKRFSLLLAEKGLFVTAAIDSEYASQTFRLDKQRWYTVTYSTRIQQIDGYGQAREHELPPDTGTGYIWRLYSVERFEERDGGVYTELEVVALSRNIPFGLQWLVKPIVQRLPRNSMIATLQKTRDAVCAAEASKAAEVARIPTFSDTNEMRAAAGRNHQVPSSPPASAAKTFGFHGKN